MTNRRPIVIVSGLQQELPAGDNVADPVLAAQAQLLGYSTGAIAEVEAAAMAIRSVLYPYNGDGELAFSISHHAIGMQLSHIATTTWTTNSQVAVLANYQPVIVAIRRLTIAVVTSAESGTRAGGARIDVQQIINLMGLEGLSNWQNPASRVGGGILSSLRTGQDHPLLAISTSQNGAAPNGIGTWTGIQNNTANIAQAVFGASTGAPGGVGVTHLPPTNLIDYHPGEAPYILPPNQGIYIGSTFPVASTSQSVNYSVNIQWDEWQPRTPIAV